MHNVFGKQKQEQNPEKGTRECISMRKGITGERRVKSLEDRNFFLEKLIKARPIKMVTSFLALLEPGMAAHLYQGLLRG